MTTKNADKGHLSARQKVHKDAKGKPMCGMATEAKCRTSKWEKVTCKSCLRLKKK